jgi:glucose-6-phosphate 1-dehydrogenase
MQISPEIVLAIGMMAITPGNEKKGSCVEMEASRHPAPDEMDAYERLLGDAMRGNPTLFAREDSVEEAWRIVDPILKADLPVYEYDPGTWGPSEVDSIVCPPGGWHNPGTPTPACESWS